MSSTDTSTIEFINLGLAFTNFNADPNDSQYGYVPTTSTCIIFVVLFSLSTLMHSWQAIRYRMWWIYATICLCGVIEVLGWASRLWSSYNPLAGTPFKTEITATIVAPTPLLAANFVVLGEIIKILGPAYSRLPPKWYTLLFCTCDVVSLFVQGGGGGIAASSNDQKTINMGGNIMLGGIVFQLVVIVIYSVFSVEYLVRYHKNSPLPGREVNREDKRAESIPTVRGQMTKSLRTILYALGFTTVCLFIRAVYRVIELADGWNGKIFTTQIYFNVLDGAMVILAIFTWNFIHPGKYLAPEYDDLKALSATPSVDMQVLERETD